MKLIIEQAALQKALARVVGVVAARNTIPVLSNVAIDAAAGEVWITATDLDVEAKARVDARIEQEGSVTAPAGLMSDLVRSAPSGSEVALTHGGDDPRLILQFGRSRYQLPVLGRKLFPALKPLEGAATVVIQAVELETLLSRVAFAQGADQSRIYLSGVYLHRSDAGDLTSVTTDGHRLALARAAAPSTCSEDLPGAIVPTKAVTEFVRALNGRAGEVTLTVSTAGVVLDMGDAVIRTKVIDANFVDYGRVVPNDWAHEAVVDRQVLLNTVRRIALVTDNKDRAIHLSFENDRLTIQGRNMESGQGAEEMEVTFPGDRFEIGFNARYVIDALGQTEAETVVMRFTDVAGPCRVEPSPDDPEHGPVLAIILPQRV